MRAHASLALAVALVLSGCVSTDTFRKRDAEAKKLEAESKQYKQFWEDETGKRAITEERLKTLQAQLDTVSADLESLREKVRSDEGSLSQKEAELRAARTRLADLQALVDELSKSKKKLEAAKAELEKKSSEYEQLASALRSEIDSGRIELNELRGKTTVKMKDKILFASGSATLGADGREALRKVADALRGLQGKAIRVDGHTDNVPTGGAGGFATNWELSAARALAVVRFLQEFGVDATRLSGAGFGEYQPVSANDSPEGRSLNRRIEITLVPLEGAVASPPAQVPAVKPASGKM